MVVSYEVEDGVAVVTIDRPEVKNAMNWDVFTQLRERAEQAGADREVGAVVVRGAGGVFSSGLDTSVFTAGGDPGAIDEDRIRVLQDAFTAYEELDKPTIAFVEGYCFGGGIQLAAACHLRAATSSASFAVMETRWAIVPDLGGTWRLPRLIGAGRTTELAMTARRVPRDEAVSLGLVELPLDGEDAFEQVLAYAGRLARGPGAVRRIPRLVRENWGQDREVALANERVTQLRCLAGPDFTEAVTAALEGREPRFVGT